MKENLLILVNENLLDAKLAVKQANTENILQLCKDYLLLLSKYRDQLYKLRGTPEICLQQSTVMARELVEQTRKAIRTSLEVTTSERNEIEALLKTFTSINGFEATKTFNRLEYKGFDNWELRTGGVRLKDDIDGKQLSIQEAVKIAGNLRRKAYVDHKIIF
jgi:hypothetical protein